MEKVKINKLRWYREITSPLLKNKDEDFLILSNKNITFQ